MDQIKAMLEAMERDTAFGEEMMALMKSGNTLEIIRLAEKKGFIFTEADYQEHMDFQKIQPANAKCRDLSPEDLEKISGGVTGDGCGINGCFFDETGDMEYRNGANRKKCNMGYTCSVPNDRCNCWGTDNCVDRWHKC